MKVSLPAFFKSNKGLLLTFVLLHIFLVYATIFNRNLCSDESDYFFYAKKWLLGNPDRTALIDDSKSPVTVIALIPRIIKQVLHPGYQVNDNGVRDTLDGRYMMIFYSLLIALYLYKWSMRLLGKRWWYVMLFFVFDPLLIAHAGIVGSDVAVGFFVLALVYHLSEYYRSRNSVHFYLCCFFTGMGIVAKVSSLYVLPLMAAVSVWLYFYENRFTIRSCAGYLRKGIIAGIIILFMINCSYYFRGSFRNVNDYTFQSDYFISKQKQLAINFPIPLPSPFIQSLDMLKKQEAIGGATIQSTYLGVYVAGLYKQKGGFWFYYLYTGLYKFPLLFILLLLAVLVIGLKKIRQRSLTLTHSIIGITIIWFLIILSCFNSFQTGLRHILIIMPLVYIALAACLKYITETFQFKFLPYVCLLYLLFITIKTYPWYFTYTNELLTDKKGFYRKIGDSSMDYNQNKADLDAFIRENAWIKTAPAKPDTGWYIINVQKLMNFKHYNNNEYNWLKNHFTPKYVLQGVNLVYYVSKEELNE